MVINGFPFIQRAIVFAIYQDAFSSNFADSGKRNIMGVQVVDQIIFFFRSCGNDYPALAFTKKVYVFAEIVIGFYFKPDVAR